MPGSEYYDHTTYPAINATGSSSALRAELDAIEAAFDLLPGLSGNGGKVVVINSGGTEQEAVASLTVAQGGTGRATGTTAYGLIAAGTTATGAQQTLPAGATTEILVGGGASALPVWTAATGSGAPVRATSPTLVTPALGTPSSGNLANCTFPTLNQNTSGNAATATLATTASAVAVGGITGMGTGVGTFLATPSSANLKAALTDETGSGAAVFATSPTLVTPALGVATATSINSALIGQTASNSNYYFGAEGFTNITTGAWNTCIATVASALTSGEDNVSIGDFALTQNSTGSNNTAVGTVAGTICTGSQNTFLGSRAGEFATTGYNCTVVGYGATKSAPTVNNELTIGDSRITALRCQVTSITSLSDARDKTDIKPLYAGLSTVMQLKPVSFTWNMRDGGKVGIKDSGFIAQDLQRVDDDYLRLVYAENPEKLEASYGRLIPVLVNAIQELKAEFDAYRLEHP